MRRTGRGLGSWSDGIRCDNMGCDGNGIHDRVGWMADDGSYHSSMDAVDGIQVRVCVWGGGGRGVLRKEYVVIITFQGCDRRYTYYVVSLYPVDSSVLSVCRSATPTIASQ